MRFDRTRVYRWLPSAGTLRVAGGLSLGVGVAPVVVGGASLLAGLALDAGTVSLLAWGIRLVFGVVGLALLAGPARAGDSSATDDSPGLPAVVVIGATLVGIAAGSLVVAALVAPLGAVLAAVLPPGVEVEAGVLRLFSLGIHLLAATLGATTLQAVGLFYAGSWARTGE